MNDTHATSGIDDEAPPVLFRMPIDLRWRDLDAFNHVNNANFMTLV